MVRTWCTYTLTGTTPEDNKPRIPIAASWSRNAVNIDQRSKYLSEYLQIDAAGRMDYLNFSKFSKLKPVTEGSMKWSSQSEIVVNIYLEIFLSSCDKNSAIMSEASKRIESEKRYLFMIYEEEEKF